jgi:hypothetical protein
MICGHTLSFWLTYGSLSLNGKPPYLPLSKEDCSSELWFESSSGLNETMKLPGAKYTYIASAYDHPEL